MLRLAYFQGSPDLRGGVFGGVKAYPSGGTPGVFGSTLFSAFALADSPRLGLGKRIGGSSEGVHESPEEGILDAYSSQSEDDS